MAANPKSTIQPIPELVGPDYNIYRLRSDFYKVVRFKSTALRACHISHDNATPKNTDKLPQALSRARRVCLEIALCNDWKWFCTFTVAKNNYDRKNLDGFYEKFSEWLKYQRKKCGKKIPYLLVPEQHGDGSWHMHGFFNSDVDELLISFRELDKQGYRSDDGKRLPRKLITGDFFNWPAYQKSFGFCSLGKIRNHDATAFYASKYISKSFVGDAQRVGLKLYYCSQGLNRAAFLDSLYGPCDDLDKHLVNHYEYCSTGFVRYDREPGDDPIVDLIEIQNSHLFPMKFDDVEPEVSQEVDHYYDVTQLCLSGF